MPKERLLRRIKECVKTRDHLQREMSELKRQVADIEQREREAREERGAA